MEVRCPASPGLAGKSYPPYCDQRCIDAGDGWVCLVRTDQAKPTSFFDSRDALNQDYLLTQIRCMLDNASLRTMSQKYPAALPDLGVDIFFAGKKHRIAASQLQMLDLLFSTFEVYIQKNKELEEMNKQLAEKNEKVRALQGLVPICANCKKIRDDDGYWQQVDRYLAAHSQADFNLSICPQCAKKETKIGPVSLL